jgi:hypothetical protein
MRFVFFFAFLSSISFAYGEIKIDQISTKRKMVIARSTGGEKNLKLGSEFIATLSDGSQCSTELVKIDMDKLFLDAGNCNLSLLKKGLDLTTSGFDGVQELPLVRDNNEINRKEDWYTMWNYVPFTFVTLDSENDRKFQSNETSSGADLLGFYWPMGPPGLIVGGVLNYYYHDDKAKEAQFTSLEVASFSSSALYFFANEIGRGIFARFDLGIQHSRYEHTPGVVSSSNPEQNLSSTGLGTGIGIGGSMPISNETRLLIQAVYRRNLGGDLNASATQFMLGLLL